MVNVNFKGIEPQKLTWGVKASQRQIKDYGVGLIAPQTPRQLKQPFS